MFPSFPGFGATDPGSAAWASFVDHPKTTAFDERDELPWVEPGMLEDLEEQMGSRDIAWRFARDYADLWPKRQRALVAAVERQDLDAALDAALSLKNSSAMVGGIRLARAAQALEAVIRAGADLDSAGSLLSTVADYGRATVDELQQTYLCRDASGPHPVPGS